MVSDLRFAVASKTNFEERVRTLSVVISPVRRVEDLQTQVVLSEPVEGGTICTKGEVAVRSLSIQTYLFVITSFMLEEGSRETVFMEPASLSAVDLAVQKTQETIHKIF